MQFHQNDGGKTGEDVVRSAQAGSVLNLPLTCQPTECTLHERDRTIRDCCDCPDVAVRTQTECGSSKSRLKLRGQSTFQTIGKYGWIGAVLRMSFAYSCSNGCWCERCAGVRFVSVFSTHRSSLFPIMGDTTPWKTTIPQSALRG